MFVMFVIIIKSNCFIIETIQHFQMSKLWRYAALLNL